MAQVQDHVLQWLGGNYIPLDQQPLTIGNDIESFEQDFANGYLIGKILTQYGICESIDTFSKKTNKEAKVHNFFQIEDALRSMKVQFDAKLIHNVMSEEVGASIRLLYIIKLGVDKMFSKSDQSVTGLKQRFVDQKVKQVRDLEVKLPKIHKEYGIIGPSIKSKKLHLVEEKLLKYELAKVNLFKKVINDDKTERTMLMNMQQHKRQDLINKIGENKEFMKEWNETGYGNWKTNQQTRAFEISRGQYFEDREVRIYKDQLTRELNQNTNDMQGGIYEFHENLRKLGIEENITIQEAMDRQEKKQGIPPGQIQNFSYAATMNKIKETKNQNEFAGKERERRQRKLKVDQIKIQEMLDSQKKEELLLQRLLAKQTEEQKQSYSNWRTEKCKQIITNNKFQKAENFKQERLEMTAQIEKKMRDEAIAGEGERQNLHNDNKSQLKQVRREEKLIKRRLNVEIASEIIDLIMDVADEAFNHQDAHKNDMDECNKQLHKETWRDWMDILTSGKKVSEANIVIQKDEVIEKQESEKNPLARLLGLGSETMATAQVLDRVKNEQIYSDFLQYISISGSLNMRLFAPNKWENMIKVIQSDPITKLRNINLEFLQSSTIPTNPELGQLIQTLYSAQEYANSENRNAINNTSSAFQGSSTLNIQKTQSLFAPSKMEIIKEEEQVNQTPIPLWHTLKLCVIGKAYSGKKSVAQMIKDQLGDQITLFNMDEILREALIYVSPEKKEEVPDSKAKGKGKPAEAGSADIFAGLDIANYKEIASELLKQVYIQTGQEKVPGKEINLISLIKNDIMLVNLFIEKLKLTFNEPGPIVEDQESKMRENLIKVEELQTHLAEAIEHETQAAEQHNAKGGKQAKGGGKNATKSSKEMQEEIDQLMSVEKNGWVLIDFPRTINQAKLLENMLTGYRSPSDQPKSFIQLNQEIWTNFADPEEQETQVTYSAQNAFFDSVFLLDTSREECVRRGQQRKIDTTTGTVYHLEDQPPPNDQKLIDRLQDSFGSHHSEHEMIAFLDQSHIECSDYEPLLHQFYQEFGTIDSEIGKGIASFKAIKVDQKIDKTQVFFQVNSKLEEILKFKQVSKDRDYQALRQKIIGEIETQELAKAQNPDKTDEMETEIKLPENENSVSRQSPIGVSTTNDKLIQRKMSDVTSDQLSKRSRSVSQVGGLKRGKKKEFTKDYKIKIWEEMTLNYFREGIITINQVKKQSETVIDCLNESQNDFIQFLERPDDKQQYILDFVNSFNQFSQEFPDLRQDDQTKEELLQRVEKLCITLWDKIEQKKEESLNEIQRLAEEGWSALEMKQVCKSMAQMIEIEIKKFNTVYQIAVEQDPLIELDAEIMVKKMLERGSKLYDAKTKTSPIFNNVIAKLTQSLDDLTVQTQKQTNFGTNPNALILEQEKNIFLYRLALIQAWALTSLEEISTYSQEVYSLMDDWIVETVSIENTDIQGVLDSINEFIRSSDTIMNEQEYIIQPAQLYGRIEMKAYGINQQPLYLQKFQYPQFEIEQTRFEVGDLNHVFQQMKKIIGEKGSFDLLDQQSLINLMMLAFRQGCIPSIWKYMSIEKIQNLTQRFKAQALPGMIIGSDEPSEYQSKLNSSMTRNFQLDQNRQWVHWKKLLLHFVLLNSPVPTAQQISEYEKNLSDVVEDRGAISCEQFIEVTSWFDQTEGKADSVLTGQWLEEAQRQSLVSEFEDEDVSVEQVYSRLDENRLFGIKSLVFNIFRDKIGQDLLNLADFITILNEISSTYEGKTFSSVLFD